MYDREQLRKSRRISFDELESRFDFTCPSTGSSCWSVARTKTAVLPMPDLAWHKISVPRIAWGIVSCWTRHQIYKIVIEFSRTSVGFVKPSDGCSKPKSIITRRSSGFNRKSLKPLA